MDGMNTVSLEVKTGQVDLPESGGGCSCWRKDRSPDKEWNGTLPIQSPKRPHAIIPHS